MHQTVGIVGCGTIGAYLYRELCAAGIQVGFLCDTDLSRPQALNPDLAVGWAASLPLTVDLVVETATADWVSDNGPAALEQTNLVVFSLTALADADLHHRLIASADRTGHTLYLPHGAVPGIDGIQDGRRALTDVTITTTKPPGSLARCDSERQVLYDGPSRGACRRFPRNTNVHAAVSLAGLGFDKTRSIVISDPNASGNIHDIRVSGEGFEFSLQVESRALGGVTGMYTPECAASIVRRICSDSRVVMV